MLKLIYIFFFSKKKNEWINFNKKKKHEKKINILFQKQKTNKKIKEKVYFILKTIKK